MHSAFVFELYSALLKKSEIDFESIVHIRKKYGLDSRTISVTDFGAGAKSSKNRIRKIKDIIRFSSKNKIYYELISKLIHFQKYTKIIELGTSLGIGSSYLAQASADVELYTFEGCPETLKIAQETFDNLGLKNISGIVGNIDITLPAFLTTISHFDLAYIDANHRYEPTMAYFEQLKVKAKPHSCIVFDDIYWSADMTRAWKDIKADPAVSISLDFFEIGIVFFRKEIAKQDFVLKY